MKTNFVAAMHYCNVLYTSNYRPPRIIKILVNFDCCNFNRDPIVLFFILLLGSQMLAHTPVLQLTYSLFNILKWIRAKIFLHSPKLIYVEYSKLNFFSLFAPICKHATLMELLTLINVFTLPLLTLLYSSTF